MLRRLKSVTASNSATPERRPKLLGKRGTGPAHPDSRRLQFQVTTDHDLPPSPEMIAALPAVATPTLGPSFRGDGQKVGGVFIQRSWAVSAPGFHQP